MARTRNSDPGRVTALHYAATPRQRHAKRLVYAYFCALWLGAGIAQAQERNGPGVPCVACQTLSVAPSQVASFPDRLSGARVLLRIGPGANVADWSSPLQELRRRGGSAGLHLTGIPAEDDPALAGEGDTLVVEVGAGDPDRLAFDLKRALTVARGRRPAATLLIAAPPEVATALRARGIDSYIDGVLPIPSIIRSP